MNRRDLLQLALAAVSANASMHANVRVNINLGMGHPLRRPARTVIVRRPAPVMAARAVYAPAVVWNTRTVVALPARDRLVWEDSETLRRREDWVDLNFRVNNRGEALYLRVNGRAQIDFAEIVFRNGQTQVVDCNEAPVGDGVYPLFDFRDGREVEYVRMVARSRAPQSTITVLMRK